MPNLPMRRAAPRYVTVRRQVERLLKLLRNHESVLILTHNDPDPDGLAASWGLRFLIRRTLGLHVRILYGGVIGRAENRAMVDLLEMPIEAADGVKFGNEPVILVDAQPGAMNSVLPKGVTPLGVIDHHPQLADRLSVPFHDIHSEFGATATIVTRYLWSMEIEPSTPLATALFYGIKTDTLGLSRAARRADALAYLYLHERADLPLIGSIERAQLSKDYFAVMSRALRASWVYGDVVVSVLGELQHADMSAEVADLLMRLQGVKWVLCVGTFNKVLTLALRTEDPGLNAGKVIRRLVGDEGSAGGHSEMAGGRLPYKGSKKAAEEEIVRRFLELMQVDKEDGERLISR